MRLRKATRIRLVLIAGMVLALEAACRTGLIRPFTMIPPSEMFVSLLRLFQSPEVLSDIGQTLRAVALSLSGALVVGFLIGSLALLGATGCMETGTNPQTTGDPTLSTEVPSLSVYPSWSR